MKAIVIDSINRKAEVRDIKGTISELREIVGGPICYATSYSNGDTLYVDDEGLLKNPEYFFTVKGCTQPLAGNGILVGMEIEDYENDTYYHADVGNTIEDLEIIFMNRTTAMLIAEEL